MGAQAKGRQGRQEVQAGGRRRRLRGSGSITQRPDGKYTGRVWVEGPGGQKYRKSITGVSPADVQTKLNTLQREAPTVNHDSSGDRQRRLRGSGSITQRPDGKYTGRVWVEGPGGQKYRKSVTGVSPADVQAKLNKLQRVPIVNHGSRMRIDAWSAYWLENIVHGKPRTMQAYESMVRLHINPRIGHIALDRLTMADVRELHKKMVQNRKSNSTGHAAQAHAILRTMLQAAVKEGLITVNVAANAGAPKVTSRRHSPVLSRDQVRQLIDATREDWLGDRWVVALLTGTRQGELLGLTWDRVHDDHVDFSWQLQRLPWRHGCGNANGIEAGQKCPRRELAVEPGFEYELLRKDKNFAFTRRKITDSRLSLPMTPELREALDRQRKRTFGLSPYNLVFCKPNGDPYDARADQRYWKDALETAGLPAVKLHSLRHTTATLLLEQGYDLATIQRILGHLSSFTTTGYAHMTPPIVRAAIETLGKSIID